jgi:hypothetical protein
MSYNINIPQGTDQTLQSQKQLLSNFQTIDSLFGANHYPLTGEQNYQGMHTVLTMQPQGGDPPTNATQISLYNKLDINSIPALFFAPNNSQTPIQLTYPFINTTSTNTQQYTFVAGPFVIYGGKIKNPTNGQVITLSPTSNLLYVGLTRGNSKTLSARISYAPTPTNINSPPSTFTINYENVPSTIVGDIYYLVIGQ